MTYRPVKPYKTTLYYILFLMYIATTPACLFLSSLTMGGIDISVSKISIQSQVSTKQTTSSSILRVNFYN